MIYNTHDWDTGIAALCRASYSAAQALGVWYDHPPSDPIGMTEFEATLVLLDNVRSDLAYGDQGATCEINIHQTGVEYATRNGLLFGWCHYDICAWRFFLGHPSGSFPEGSTLRESALAAGFKDD